MALFGVQPIIDKVTHAFTWRMIMPKYEGVQFCTMIENIKHPNELVLLSLKVMIKLYELHTKRIVHGDFNTQNILVKQCEKLEYNIPTYKITIVDFGHSSARGTKLEGHQPAKDVVFAPELTHRENRLIFSDTPQDVYMLAYCLNYAVNKFVEKSGGDGSQYQHDLAPLYRFIKAGLSDSPTARPLLVRAVYEIKQHLAQVSKAPLMAVKIK